ncbi:carbohydrate ABC transporter permease [Myceligenerans indicum]|uniref:Carbohydrate ABC transporter permease n=1 Tax=Myceligenerans indicum TaxID=2593663 RepID=A0ABS1LI84_9MICO|nr:carbohydrate ABC transporter permease [Myceligenerans indicum]MBL0885950.1 carbohydrate ABC transporter permease [Myceligenerans indicum]
MTTDTITTPATTTGPRTPPELRRHRPSVRTRVFRVLRQALMIAVVVVALYPILWMIVSSLRPDGHIFGNPSLVPNTFEVSNYTSGWNALGAPFSTYLLNSALVVAGAIVGNLISCSMAAYGFARLRFRFQRPAFVVMLLMIMIPIHVVIVPQYVIWAQAGLINTVWPLIVPKFLATDGFFVFLMIQFIRGLPKELDEAARIDGAGHGRIFCQILLPLMTPALATTAIFTFIWTWNDFFSQLIYLTDPNLYTVPVALRSFVDAQSQSSYGAMFAMSVVSVLPLVVAFGVGQKYLVRGIATTGGK